MSLQPTRLDILPDASLSLDELAAYQSEGFSVLRTAHVGNVGPYNLAIAAAGLPVSFLDYNVTGKDTTYRPEQLVTQADVHVLTTGLGKLSCRTEVESAPPLVTEQGLQTGRYLDEIHVNSIAAATSSDRLWTDTSYLRKHEATTEEAITVARRYTPTLFDRLVNPDGSLRPYPEAAREIGKLGVLPLVDDPRSPDKVVMLPNAVNILATFAIEALTAEQPSSQYHLAGPAMIHYLPRMQPLLEFLFGKLREDTRLGSLLPSELSVHVVPSSEAVYATTLDRRDRLDHIISTYAELASVQEWARAERKKLFQSHPDASSTTEFAAIKQAVGTNQEALRQALGSLPELLDGQQFRPPTQYDVLAKGLYVHSANTSLSMQKLKELTKDLRKLA